MKDRRKALIQAAFLQLRQEGLSLGIAELVVALQAEQAGFGGDTLQSLQAMLALVWCASEAEQGCLLRTWETLQRQKAKTSKASSSAKSLASGETLDQGREVQPAPAEKPTVAETAGESLGIVPTRAPVFTLHREELTELRNYYPVDRRRMQYAWRYLRRIIADGPRDVLDVAATIEQTARQGFCYAPVLRRRERNHAQLVLLLDHLGSMVPFHHYLRDLVETAQYESELGRQDQVEIYYFYNVPGDSLYIDPLLKEEQVALPQVLKSLNEFTAVLIVSDAGAARRHHELDRILETEAFLEKLRAVTTYVAWLNPMPKPRWLDTSAEIIARQVDMFPMNPDGLSDAVDVLRGLRPSAPP